MRKSKMKDYVIIKKEDNQFLYGRVYEDIRFPNGHLILTTKIIELNKDEKTAITENNTQYILENELTIEKFTEKIKKDYIDSKYINFILSPLKV